MKIYTYKQLYKPGKVITVHKKEERNIYKFCDNNFC